ncbi:MAG TPA: spore coat protein U domain-containing protein, partial [Burkholderiales bacterium]|nr:spore coat protein U domain-containing protein [Burkholderiales bacterium]
SHTVNVSATVTGNCKFVNSGGSTPLTLSIDPTATTTASGTADVLYRCTNGTSPIFALTSASLGSTTAGNLGNGSETIPYAFSSTNEGAGAGFGAGSDKKLTVTVTVDQTDAASVSAGTYTDDIAVTINN